MRRRNSLKKSHWSLTPEQWYEKECSKILYDKQLELEIDYDVVYLKSAGGEEFLLRITQLKKAWYEIWKKLKDI
jgi:hypothetical protein